jgi:hypothetical protein
LTTGTAGQYDVWCTVKGSGHSGQAGAIRLGISRSLDKFVPGLRLHLKPGWKTHTLFSLAYEAHASRCACLTSTPRPPHYFSCFVLFCDAAVQFDTLLLPGLCRSGVADAGRPQSGAQEGWPAQGAQIEPVGQALNGLSSLGRERGGRPALWVCALCAGSRKTHGKRCGDWKRKLAEPHKLVAGINKIREEAK